MTLVVFLNGCLDNTKDGEPQGNIPDENGAGYQIISLGTINDNAAKYIELLQPTADYIAAKLSDNETQYIGKVVVVKTEVDMSGLIINQEVDLFFGDSFKNVFIAENSGSVPFLRRWQQGGAEHHSVFIVKNNSAISSLDDFVGKTIAFENSESITGYLLPKAYLIDYLLREGFNESQTIKENNVTYVFKVVFSEENQNTVSWVLEGKVDIGALSNLYIEDQPESIKGELKIVNRTIDVPRQMVSYRSELDPDLVERVAHIFLDMDKDEEGIEILQNFENTTKYDEIPNAYELFSAIDKMLTLLE